MKNLKKVLSLVLALAMALSLMTVAFAKDAADFADYDEINYKEAVDVMVATGIFDGTGNNNFSADVELTREQAAKIITYMLVGQEKADKLTTTVAPYADVAADRWSAGAIAYCTNEGILAGAGNGYFNPTGKLDGLAFSKMLLTALGYDASIEKLTGATWAINAAKLAIDAELDAGMEEISLSSVLTREQAAQMAFNAMKADLVDYENRGTELKLVDGSIVIVGASKAAPVTTTKAFGRNISADSAAGTAADPYTVQFAEKYQGDLVMANSDPDTMGRPAHEWTFDKESVGVYTDTADYTAYVTADDATLVDVIDEINKKFVDADAIENACINGVNTLNPNTDVAVGDYVEIYMDSDNAKLVDTIAVTHKTVEQLSDDAATKVSGDDTLVKVPGVFGYNANCTTENVFGYEGLVEDDIVLYYQDNDGNYYFEKAESFDGILTAVSGTEYTVSGTKYDRSEVTNVMDGSTIVVTNFYKENATWYTDNDGNIIWVEGVESTELAYLLATYTDSDTAAGGDVSTVDTYYGTLVKMDGTILTKVELEDNYNGWANSFVKYSVKDNVYTLTDTATYVANTTAGDIAFTNTVNIAKNNPQMTIGASTVNGNNNTVYLVRDYKANGTAKNTYTVYTGYTNVPTLTTATMNPGAYAMAYVGSNNYAQYVVIDPKTNVTSLTTTEDIFFVVDNTVTTLYDADGIYGYSIKVVKGGQLGDLQFANNPGALAEGSAYQITSYNSDKQVASFGGSALTTGKFVAGTTTGKDNNGVITLNNVGYSYTEDTVVYYVNEDGVLSTDTVADIDDDINDQFFAIRATNNSADEKYNTLDYIFINEVVTGAYIDGSVTISLDTTTINVGADLTSCGAGATWTADWYVDGVYNSTATSFDTTTIAAATPAVAHSVYAVLKVTVPSAGNDGHSDRYRHSNTLTIVK